ncbi:hypothetical protein CFC21_092395, partial [Triticum aestivum]
GPQYVCTNFWTFVCTNCSGAHREFTHRVKSVSMAKFTAQEVTALQGGGNERAREIFFKEWDSQRNPYPDSSNTDKLRNFIKHIYVERRYTGERSSDRPPRGKDDKDEHSENRRSDGNRGGSRSPPYNESYSDRRSYSGRSDDRNSRHSYGERSPGYDQNDYKKSPRHFEAVDDRSGKTTPVQRFEDRRFSEPRKPETGSPNYQREANGSSPPVVRPVREILGDDAPQLRIDEPPKPNVARPIDPPKPNGTRTIEPPPQAQRTSTASSIGSSEGISEQTKAATPVSLIDFGADPEPTASAPPSQTAPTPQQQPVSAQPINATTPQHVLEQGKSAPSVSGGDWASFDAFGQQQQTPQVGSTVNPLESVLAQLSFSETPSASNTSAFSTSVDPQANGGQLSMIDTSHSSLFGPPVGISGNQVSTGMPVQGSAVHQSAVAASMGGLPSQLPSNSQGTSGIQEATSSHDSKSSGRTALPVISIFTHCLIDVDFFTSLYPSATPAMPGWQRAPQSGMGFGMQYPAAMSRPLGASAGATNPTLVGNSSFGVPPQQPQQMYQPSVHQNHYMMQHVSNNMPEQLPNGMLPRQQGGAGSLGVGYDQQAAPRYSQPNTPPSYGAVGGNPFG